MPSLPSFPSRPAHPLTRPFSRAADRLLARFVPATSASASRGDNCFCQCSDACFRCCQTGTAEPGGIPTYTCRVANTGECG
ncbi:hypothetical protein AB0I28_25400 [Phytomonospora sp. NPDC050363]|uniref:hypothetical protein n=1 Tax=Phytomonospora sp. NPDC050363 TaxID=3155642 RepID=UPI0033E3C671